MRNISCRLLQRILVGKKDTLPDLGQQMPKCIPVQSLYRLRYQSIHRANQPHSTYFQNQTQPQTVHDFIYMTFSSHVKIFHVKMNCWSIKMSYILHVIISQQTKKYICSTQNHDPHDTENNTKQ
jgi:hypothetical protein